jgi:Ca-activated chloride channel family protein
MTEDFADLKDLIRSETAIEQRQAAREAAIAAAMAHYEKNVAISQGTAGRDRLMAWVRGFIRGKHTMHSMKFNRALMAGSSLAVLTIAVIVTAEVQVLRQAMPLGETKSKAVETTPSVALQMGAGKVAMDLKKEAGQNVPAAPALNELADEAMPRSAASGAMMAYDADQQVSPSYHDQGRDKFTDITPNPVKIAATDPVSTFSIDADSASYSFVRGSLAQNVLPQKDAVRVEEMINYFPYDYAGPSDRNAPFKATVTLMPTPWNAKTELMHIGIKGFSLNGAERPHTNLVFLLDTSGSMEEPNKLPLLKASMKMLVETLQPSDTVAIVTYAGSAGTVLAPTAVSDKAKILASLDNLEAGGSTAGAEGIRQAYSLAESGFDKTGINRVILATDGDFNVGITDPEELKSFVERKRETGVYLSVLGFGRGNYNDDLMQTLAQNGNGNASYIDTLNEARKVLVDEASNTLFPIAKDVKIQVEFNPATVSEYRLIGYETRLLNREDFNNDKVDAGEIGSGHTVTAIYEITPKGTEGLVDPLRYAPAGEQTGGNELAFVKIRYKLPNEETSRLITEPVTEANAVPSTEARFSAAVAAFGQLLRGGQYTKAFTYDDVIALAQANKGPDEFGYRSEFINLVRMAKTAQALEPLNP